MAKNNENKKDSNVIEVSDPKIIEEMINLRGLKAIDQASRELKLNEAFVFDLIKKHGMEVLSYTKEICGNEDFMLKAINFDCNVLSYAEDLRKNVDFMIKACQVNKKCAEYVDKSISQEFDNKSAIFVMKNSILSKIAKRKNIEKQEIPEILTSDEDFMLTLMNYNIEYFDCVSDNLKNDPDFLAKAILRNSNVREVVIPTEEGKVARDVIKNEYIFSNIDPEFKNNPKFIMNLVKSSNNLVVPLYALPKGYSMNKNFMLEACDQNVLYSQYADESLANDEDFLFDIEDIVYKNKPRGEKLAEIVEKCPCGVHPRFLWTIFNMSDVLGKAGTFDDYENVFNGYESLNSYRENCYFRPQTEEILDEYGKELEEQNNPKRKGIKSLLSIFKKSTKGKSENESNGPTQE